MSANFRRLYGREPAASAWTPGRVNLIGEHTDYNGGLVMPMALALGVRVHLAPGPRLRISSNQFNESVDRAADEAKSGHWSDYVLGALQAVRFGGADIEIDGDLPLGAGLSSSAALIVAVLRAAGMADATEVALAAQRVENDFIGVPCGIMDQMAVAHLGAGELMTLDTASLNFTRRTPPRNWRFAVHHSGVKRALVEGHYAERRADCEAAARALSVRSLCVLPELPQDAAVKLTSRQLKRARHIISEHARVAEAERAMAGEDVTTFARLMDESHASMRDDFEITTPQVDAVVEASRKAGALGARMTGGGFGGCIVSLVEDDAFSAWRARMAELAPSARFVA